jgi:hypothetical protein
MEAAFGRLLFLSAQLSRSANAQFAEWAVQQSMYRLANDYDRMAEVRERELGMKGGEQIH